MQELAPNVYYETSYAGVTLGAINWPHGLVLIDSPFLETDIRNWRSALLNLSGGIGRMLVTLDSHYDRTLGSKGMECPVIGHENLVNVFQERPNSFKAQVLDTGADWEQYGTPGSIRWHLPEIAFTDKMVINWDDTPIIFEHRPGPTQDSIWVDLPGHKIIFLGDAVLDAQPPFLALADIPAWIENLQLLLTPAYQEYLFISGRCGLVTTMHIRAQHKFLVNIHKRLEVMASRQEQPEKTDQLVSVLLSSFDIDSKFQHQYQQRLRTGLRDYYIHHYRNPDDEPE